MKEIALLSPSYDAELINVADFLRDPYRYMHEERLHHPLTFAPLRPVFRDHYVYSCEGFVLKRGYGNRDANWSDDIVREITRLVFLSTKELRVNLPGFGRATLRWEQITADHRFRVGPRQFCHADLFATLVSQSDLCYELGGALTVEITTFTPVGPVRLRHLLQHNFPVLEYQVPPALLQEFGCCDFFDGNQVRQLRDQITELMAGVVPISILHLPTIVHATSETPSRVVGREAHAAAVLPAI